MGFRYDTRHLSAQQQAIISKRDEEDKLRKRQKEKDDSLKKDLRLVKDAFSEGLIYTGYIQDGNRVYLKFESSFEVQMKEIIIQAENLKEIEKYIVTNQKHKD